MRWVHRGTYLLDDDRTTRSLGERRAMKRIVVLGGGFAGLWSAVGAARKLDELGIQSDRIEVVLVDRTDCQYIERVAPEGRNRIWPRVRARRGSKQRRRDFDDS